MSPRRRKSDRPSALDPGRIVYAIGDIHGRADLLVRLLEQIRKEQAGADGKATLIFLGDYIDRGDSSREVIDTILALPAAEFDVVALCGNHEDALLGFLRNPTIGPSWAAYGAVETLRSYGVVLPEREEDLDWDAIASRFAKALPREHREFLEQLPHSVSFGDYFFSHAGAHPSRPLDRQSPNDLMWVRDEFLSSNHRFEQVVVHGHTPALEIHSDDRRIGLDTGAYATDNLSMVRLEGPERRFFSTERSGDSEFSFRFAPWDFDYREVADAPPERVTIPAASDDPAVGGAPIMQGILQSRSKSRSGEAINALSMVGLAMLIGGSWAAIVLVTTNRWGGDAAFSSGRLGWSQVAVLIVTPFALLWLLAEVTRRANPDPVKEVARRAELQAARARYEALTAELALEREQMEVQYRQMRHEVEIMLSTVNRPHETQGGDPDDRPGREAPALFVPPTSPSHLADDATAGSLAVEHQAVRAEMAAIGINPTLLIPIRNARTILGEITATGAASEDILASTASATIRRLRRQLAGHPQFAACAKEFVIGMDAALAEGVSSSAATDLIESGAVSAFLLVTAALGSGAPP